ncbi:MAG TPA: GAF domain-containing protein [Candidatus Limnocylindria bacterium]|nr:GAF domain-containing protein [Candidatus Limnocylindria bacterium]
MTPEAELLKGAVTEVARLLQADGAMIYLVDEASETLRFAYDAGITDRRARRLIRDLNLPIGVGMFGTTVSRRQLTVTDDYPADKRFEHSPVADEIVHSAGMRSMAVTPLVAGERVIGAMGAYANRPAAFSEAQIRLLRALGDHAATAIANRQQAAELKLRVETQRTLQKLAARITAIRDPDELLQQVVDGAQRLIGSDGAHLTLRDSDAPILRPHVITGGMDDATRAWLAKQELPIGGGMNGIAAEQGAPVWTNDYLVDPRIPHTEDDQAVAGLMGLRGMAVAPLRAPEGEIFGTLAISWEHPHPTTADELELLQSLADIAAIAIANARLYEQMTESGRRYRFLVDNSPDLIWTVDKEGSFTYLSETVRSLIGWGPEELIGHHFAEIVAPESLPNVLEHWQRVVDEPDQPQQYRLNVLHRDGTQITMEVNGLGTIVDGEFAGGHGSVRDIRERVALEEGLRKQTVELSRGVEVQRTLGEIARSIVEVDDAGETLQQVVDASKRLLGSDGAHLTLMADDGKNLIPMVIAGDTDPETRAWLHSQRFPVGGGINGLAAATAKPAWTDNYLADPRLPHDPSDESPARLQLGAVAVAPLFGIGGEVIGTLSITYALARNIDPRDVSLLQELAGQGSIAARNARLYEQLRDSERRYRHLVDNSPDLVWSVDADGAFTYLGESLERMTGFRPEELLGRPFEVISTSHTRSAIRTAWRAMQVHPEDEQQVRLDLPLAGGGTMAVEISMVATLVDGRFAGAHGSVRDIRQRERLEQDLRRQAAALAANEERANLARELHDSVTQALFSMGLTARALELLLDRDPAAARDKLTELKELQKDALAEMRTLIFELRPQGLETDGLAQALRNHGAAVQGRTGLAVSVEVESEERLPLDIEEAFYRVAQEALHNVVKHANANSARIELRRTGRKVRLTVEDDGIGFDPAEIARGHLGLIGMQQRAERIGADLEVGHRPGNGTRVRMTLPLAATESGGSPVLATEGAASAE